jgi:hypothetical protein
MAAPSEPEPRTSPEPTTARLERLWPWALGLLLLAAVVVRILALTGRGHAGDLTALSSWAEGMARDGPAGYYAAGGRANYPPLLYLLWPLGLAFDGTALRLAIRALSIPFDLLLGAALFGMARDAARDAARDVATAAGDAARRVGSTKAGLWAAGLYLLNPAVIVSGPLWGQVDGIGALPMAVSIWLTWRGRYTSAAVLATLAGLIKPQFGVGAIVLVAVLVLQIRTPDGRRVAALAGLAAIATFAVVMLPLGLGPQAYLELIRQTTGRYPFTSLFGFNPWGAIFGFHERDRELFYVGLALTAAAIGGSVWLLRRRRDLLGLLAVGSLIALALYFLPTRVHERYLFGAIVLLAPLAGLLPILRRPFAALSGVFLITLAYVLGNTPRPVIAVPSILRGDLPAWELWLITLLLIATAGWCAWLAVSLLWGRETAADVGAAQSAEPIR